MFNEDSLKDILKKSFENNFAIRQVKLGVFQILLPYYNEDGDMVDIYLQYIGDKFLLTDFGQTLMRLTYYTEIDSDTRKKVFETILNSYNVKLSEGKLKIEIQNINDVFAYIMEMISVITKVSDISYLKQARIKSMFYEYFDNFILNDLSKQLDVNIKKDFSPDFDDGGNYATPYAIIKPNKPSILFFPILNDDRCKDTIMTLLYYKGNNFENKSIGIFNDLEEMNTKNVGKVMDLLDRPFSKFESNKEKIVSWAKELVN